MAGIYKRQELLILHQHLTSLPSFGGSVLLIFFFGFVCRRPVSCLPNVASGSGLSNLDLPFQFSLTFVI